MEPTTKYNPSPLQGGGIVSSTYLIVGGIPAAMQLVVQSGLSLIDYFPICDYPISGTTIIMQCGSPILNLPCVANDVPYLGHVTSPWGLPTQPLILVGGNLYHVGN